MKKNLNLEGLISEEEAEIVQWRISVGDSFKKGDVILEVLVEKTSIDVEADSDGSIVEILKDEGEIVLASETIAILDV